MSATLDTRGLRKSFGGSVVINDLSIEVGRGEALGVVGPNGAGKTTWFNLITGAVRADNGQVVFDGRDVTGLSQHQRCIIGMGRTFQVLDPSRT